MNTSGVYELIDKKFIGTDELRRELTDIINNLSEEKEIVITQHGKPQAILLDLESYIDMLETLEDLNTPGLIESVRKGAKEVREGEYLTLNQLKKRLKL